MTRNEKYWQSRAAQQMWQYMQDAEDTADQVAKVYAKASLYLSREMQDIFKKYVEKHHLTEKEALRILNTLRDRTSIEELQQRLQGSSQKQEIADLLAELEAPAYQARIERLQDLQTQIDLVMQQVYKQEQAIATAHYVQLAKEAYNRSIFDIQQRTGFGFSFSHIDQKQVDKVLKSKWSGMNYSERVWRNTRALAQEVKEILLVNLITGRTERETAEMLTKKFAGGSSKARRLIRTESCYLSNQLEMESYKECGIENYQYLATLDLRTSEICRELDGKIFRVKDQKPGKNCPPMHPWCRSTTIAIIGEKMLEGMKRRARNPDTGKTYLVPASMDYSTWHKKYVEANSEEWKDHTHGLATKDKLTSTKLEIIQNNSTELESGNLENLRIGNNKVPISEIKTSTYSKKFSQITTNSMVNDSIRKYAKAMLIHRNGSDGEDLYIISAETGKRLFSKTSGKNDLGVELSKDEISRIKNFAKNERIIGMHNHPTNVLPTGSDFVTAGARGYEFGIVATHDGRVFQYKVGDKPFRSEYFNRTVDKYVSEPYNYDIEKAQIETLIEFGKEFGIEWKELK